MNDRQEGIRQARAKLGDARLFSFLSAANVHYGGHVHALRLFKGRCASGTSESLDAVFYDGDIYGYSLTAERLTDSKFRIGFGCRAGPAAGDGETWEVTFEGDSVHEITNRGIWIS
jgi:hypothetical protein